MPVKYIAEKAGRNVRYGSVRVSGATLDYSVEGTGKPLLVVGSSIYYPRTFSQNIKQFCTILCADLPHFVQLDSDFRFDTISFDFYANCIETVRSAAGLEKVVVVGHSHHGNIALEYAKRYPDRVSHVVLIGSPPVDVAQTVERSEQYWSTDASDHRKETLQNRRNSMDEDYLASLSPRDAYVAQYVADAPLYWYNPDYDASWLWHGMTFGMEGLHAFRDLYRVYELNWDTAFLKAPVLILMGRYDYAVPHTLWEDVLPELKNVTFQILDQSGHTPQLEEPEAFDRILLDWLQNESVGN